MKHEWLWEQLKKMDGVPVYRCPHCHTVWLIVGANSLPSYTCKMCGRSFDPAQARYEETDSEPEPHNERWPKAA
jgi:DNA-directed RNA polymerase subunit RPC12/RpoP